MNAVIMWSHRRRAPWDDHFSAIKQQLKSGTQSLSSRLAVVYIWAYCFFENTTPKWYLCNWPISGPCAYTAYRARIPTKACSRNWSSEDTAEEVILARGDISAIFKRSPRSVVRIGEPLLRCFPDPPDDILWSHPGLFRNKYSRKCLGCVLG